MCAWESACVVCVGGRGAGGAVPKVERQKEETGGGAYQ